MNTQKYYARITKLIFLLSICILAGLIVAIVAIHQMNIGDIGDVIRAWFIMAVCALPCVVGGLLFGKYIVDYMRRIPMIQLDGTGITDNTNWLLYGTKIEWSNVIGVAVTDVRAERSRQKYVCVMLKNPDVLHDTIAGWKRPFLRMSHHILQREYLYLNLSLVNVPAHELLAKINAHYAEAAYKK